MPSDRRRDVATASVGATGVAAGGLGRHLAVRSMPTPPKVHLFGVLRRGTRRQKKLYLASMGLGLAGTAPLGVGVTRLAEKEPTAKRDGRPGFWREGLGGSVEALHGRAKAATEPVPAKVRGMQLGVAAGAGFTGSGASRLLLPKKVRPVTSPVIGALSATGSIPLTNKLVQRKHPEYKVTAYGVQRHKKAPVRPSSKASVHRAEPRSFRADLAKRAKDDLHDPWGHRPYARKVRDTEISMRAYERREGLRPGTFLYGRKAGQPTWAYKPAKYVPGRQEPDFDEFLGERKSTAVGPKRNPRPKKRVAKREDNSYLGSRTGYKAQRAAITLAGHPPVIGPFTSAAAAASYAPPGQERKAAVRQWTLGSGAGFATGVGGAYGGAHLAGKNPRAEQVASDAVRLKHSAEGAVRRALHVRPKKATDWTSRTGKLKLKALASKPGAALLGKDPAKHSARMVGATAGFLGAKALTGAVLGQTAITMNQRDQKRYNREHDIAKGETKREQHKLAERKRRSAVLSTVGGGLGLGSLAMLGAGKRQAAITTGTVGSGLSGVNALIGAKVQRQEADKVDPFVKALKVTGVRAVPKAVNGWYEAAPHAGDLREAERLAAGLKNSAGKPRWMVQHETENATKGRLVMPEEPKAPTPRQARHLGVVTGRPAPFSALAGSGGLTYRMPRIGDRVSRFNRPGGPISKREPSRPPLKTSISESDARKLIERHGLKGPLPKQLNREQRRAAYEARYVTAGGHKAEHWQHRAVMADKAKTAGIGVATAAGIPWLGARTKAGHAVGRLAARHIKPLRRVDPKRLQHHAETVIGAGATAGGASELYAAHARRKRSSYASAPAGVAASALRRMQAYDPEAS